MDRDHHQSHGAKRRLPGHHRENDKGEGAAAAAAAAANEDDDEDEDEERAHYTRVCDSYRQYATFHITREIGIHRRRLRTLSSSSSSSTTSSIEHMLPPSLIPRTSEYDERRSRLHDAAIRNQYFLDNALRHSDQETSQDALRNRRGQRGRDGGDGDGGKGGVVGWVTEDDISKVDSVLKSVARDWSAEGREERTVAYDRIIGAVTRYAPLLSLPGDDVDGGGRRRAYSVASASSKSASAADGPSNDDDTDVSISTNRPKEGRQGTRTATATSQKTTTSVIRVAVPGSGLGRLAWEIYSRGYSVEGSDFSLPMLLASDFILNGRRHVGDVCSSLSSSSSSPKFAISPWMAETKNVLSLETRLRTVIVPDVDPASAMEMDDVDDDYRPEFTMLAGEFLHLYSHFLPGGDGRDRRRLHDDDDSSYRWRRKFHVVACSYFLDTAPSLPHYLHAMYHMLEDGGLLVHFGPLMFHWSGHGGLIPGDVDAEKHGGRSDDDYDNGSAYERRNDGLDSRYLQSIDYTWEEVRDMIVNCGFVILEEETGIPAKYASDSCSMMSVVYGCVFCVARKEASSQNS
ncbi:hypothetical protein ACHAXA_007010 [Cyclostephanos tholiformis]|uniref:carnosine N-methyltransferase n=1 Tax=Cyclostephanos tholiformis TaxID=382380 RepID=A0ABD3R4C0_9STRA